MLAIATLLGLSTAPARADGPYHIPQYTGVPLMISANVVAQQSLNRSLDTHRGKSSKDASTGLPTTLVVGTTEAGMPERLAAAAPPSVRGDLQRAYRMMLDRYPALMIQLGLPPRDLAGAVASFLAGGLAAYHAVEIPDGDFKALYEQLRPIVSANFASVPLTARRAAYEQLAILGIYLAALQQQLAAHPDPQRARALKQAARAYLEQYFKIDPERVRITSAGLVAAPARR